MFEKSTDVVRRLMCGYVAESNVLSKTDKSLENDLGKKIFYLFLIRGYSPRSAMEAMIVDGIG